ncbi:MAG: peptidyl-prolyl cis-trans isomerase [Candidatus Omnitrophica bacterium]|nr:peptidyl-prolyl cis-trans isomerase [Candidatus Omnitrophota bacterium]
MRRFPFPIFAILLIGIAAILQQCGKSKPAIQGPAPDLILATAGEEAVRVQDFMIAFQESHSFDSIIVETQTAIPLVIDQIVQTLLFERDLAKKARAASLDQTNEFRREHGKTVDDELYQKVLLEEVLKDIDIRDRDLKNFYEENKDGLYIQSDTNQLIIRGIYVNFGEERSKEEARAIAEKAHAEIAGGKSFLEAAQQYSDAPAHLRGKENTYHLGAFDPVIAQRLESIQDGEITDVFELKNRFFLFKRERFIEPEYLPFDQVKNQILRTMTEEKSQAGIYMLTRNLRDKHNLFSNPGWLDDPESHEENAIILTVPGVYELTLSEFLEMARQLQKWTALEQKNYLDFLGNKALCLAEARSRGWSEEDVAPAVAYWDQKRLAQNYILAEMDQQVNLTEEKMRDFYQKNASHFQTPPRYDISRMFFSIRLTPAMPFYQKKILMLNAQAKSTAAWEAMKEGMSFDDAAAQYAQSEDVIVTVANLKDIALSDLGPQDRSFIAPSEGPALQAGEISEPKEIFNLSKERYGYEIFYVRKITPPRSMSYEEAREIIGQRVAQAQSQNLRRQLKTEFLAQNQVELNADGVQAVTDYLAVLVKRPDWQPDIARYEDPAL